MTSSPSRLGHCGNQASKVHCGARVARRVLVRLLQRPRRTLSRLLSQQQLLQALRSCRGGQTHQGAQEAVRKYPQCQAKGGGPLQARSEQASRCSAHANRHGRYSGRGYHRLPTSANARHGDGRRGALCCCLPHCFNRHRPTTRPGLGPAGRCGAASAREPCLSRSETSTTS